MLLKRDMLFTPAGKNRPLHIWLPEGYESSGERYPVMYFFDGHNLFSDADATFGKSWGLADFLQRWEKPIIIVGIECGHEGDERLYEYCPYHFTGKFWGDIQGTGAATMDFMAYELKPMIDREYRTYPFREATAIGGSSMGGLMSLYAAVKYNGVYSKAACVSSSISPCMPALRAPGSISPGARRRPTAAAATWGTTRPPRRRTISPSPSCWRKREHGPGSYASRAAITTRPAGNSWCRDSWTFCGWTDKEGDLTWSRQNGDTRSSRRGSSSGWCCPL